MGGRHVSVNITAGKRVRFFLSKAGLPAFSATVVSETPTRVIVKNGASNLEIPKRHIVMFGEDKGTVPLQDQLCLHGCKNDKTGCKGVRAIFSSKHTDGNAKMTQGCKAKDADCQYMPSKKLCECNQAEVCGLLDETFYGEYPKA